MVNMPLAPQLITEVPAGEELDDLSELIGPELATLVTADKSITIMQNLDTSQHYPDMPPGANYDNIDFNKFLGEYVSHHDQHQHGAGPHGGPGSNQTFRKVIIARKIAGACAPGQQGPGGRSEDNNNNSSDMMRTEFSAVQTAAGQCQEPGSKALLLQHRDIRSDNNTVVTSHQGPGPGGTAPHVVSSKTASGESVTLTVVRGDPLPGRGTAYNSNWAPRR